jgi:hypothetical protein
LCQLGELLAAKKIKFDLNPKMKIQSIQNLNSGLQIVQADLRVKLTGIGAEVSLVCFYIYIDFCGLTFVFIKRTFMLETSS